MIRFLKLNSRIYSKIESFGRFIITMGVAFYYWMVFLGASILSFFRKEPYIELGSSFGVQLYRMGVQALPIVGLLSFLIGIVMAYQGAAQLERFGAEIFVVDLLAIGILREIGVLMTAILIAGRTASSFTAELGMMRVNEEIDALYVMGISPLRALVVPRILAVIFLMPLIVFYANVMGLLGGALVSETILAISPLQFYTELERSVTLKNLWFGLSKAPLFGFIIALIGCYHGLTVEQTAESVGKKTTMAVVHSIFMIIVVDALFSILSRL